MVRSIQRARTVALCLSVILVLLSVSAAIAAPAAQDINPEVAVMPGELARLSWGAVIAGAILALMLQLGLNLLGVGIGVTSITPDHPGDSVGEGMKSAARTTIVWIGFSTLVSLFAGGWLAARFAGIPNNVDGMLHGLLVWGLVMIVTLLLITSTIGRILSGVSNLIGTGISMATSAAAGVARGAANVAGAAAHGAGNVASGVANAAQDAAYRARPAVEEARDQIDQRLQDELDRHPEMRQALDRQNLSRQNIEQEARTLLMQAGIPPQRVEGEANAAVQEVRDAAQVAAQQVRDDPRQAAETMMAALGRIFDRGTNMVNEVDRESVLNVMRSRGMSDQEAREKLEEWEGKVQQARMEAERVRSQAEMQIRQRINQARASVEHKVDEVRHEVEETAREATIATAQAISRIALAAFAAVLIGAIAAGIGGLIGAPEAIPTAEIDFDDQTIAPAVEVVPTDAQVNATPAGSEVNPAGGAVDPAAATPGTP